MGGKVDSKWESVAYGQFAFKNNEMRKELIQL